MALGPGDHVTENVRLEHLLGRGGMGSVWVARHVALDMDVAVKFVASEVMARDDATAAARFRREARLAARIESAHVVRTFDHGVTSDGVPYIVMELLQGESLAGRLARQKRLAPPEAAKIVAQVAEGLEQAHALGIVHRDVKPHNVFLARGVAGAAETAKLLDFGIAKSAGVTAPAEAATSTGALVGTPQYMSPEQLMRSGSHGPAIDVWALGVVAYEAIVGHLPFTGETLAATIVAITRAEMPVPSSVDAGLPGSLDAFFARALAVDPVRRFPSARALAEELALAAAGAAAPPGPIAGDARTVEPDGGAATAEFILERGIQVEGATAPTERAVAAPLAIAEPALVRARPSARWIVLAGAGAVAAGAIGLATFARGPAVAPPPPPLARTSVDVPPPRPAVDTAAASGGGAPPAAPVRIAPIQRTEVAAGAAPGHNVWLPAFSFARDEGNQGLSFLEAQAQCELRAMSLCTDSQWSKACSVNGEVGGVSSWTASATQAGVVIRGRGGCAARSSVRPPDRAPDRVALCCTRAVGISSDQKNAAFLSTTSKKLLEYEAATNAGDEHRLASIFADQVDLFGQSTPKARVLELAVESARSRVATLHDACDVRTETRDGDPGWTADCNVVSTSPAEIFLSRRRYVRGGPTGLLIDVRDTTRPIGFVTAIPNAGAR